MSIKKQEEEVKLQTEALRMLFTLFLTLSGGLVFIARVKYSDKSASSIDSVLLFIGIAIDVGLVVSIVMRWVKIKKIIKAF